MPLRWSEHDEARMIRLQRVDGLHINCRHIVMESETYCSRHEVNIKTCDGCRTCPNCDGAISLYKVLRVEGFLRDYKYQTKTCVMCGAYFEDEMPHVHKPKGNQCDVLRCEKPYKHDHEGFRICGYHQSRVEKLVVTDGVLHESLKGNIKRKAKP